MAEVTHNVPTLHTDSYLKDPSRIITYTLNHYISAPKSVSEMWVRETISLRYDIASWGGRTPQALEELVKTNLTQCLNRIFNENVSVTATLKHVDGALYELHTSVVVVVDGAPYGVSKNIRLSKDGHIEDPSAN